jgi:hypothetical protein
MITLDKNIYKQFIVDLNLLVKRIIIEHGIENNSKLVDSISFIASDSGLSMLAMDYYTYASTGRKPRARKVPLDDLIIWIKQYGIGSGNINNIAWAIQQSIFKNGIKPKNYLTSVEDTVGNVSAEKLALILADLMAEEMGLAFKTK